MAKKQSLWGRAKNWISNKVDNIKKSFSKKTSNNNKKAGQKASQKTAAKSQGASTGGRGAANKVSNSTASRLASRNPQNTALSMNNVLGKRNTVKTTQKSGVVQKAQEKQRQVKSTKERMDELNAKKNTTQKNTTQKKQSWKDTTVANSTAARRTGMTQTDFEKARKLSDITKGNVNSALAGILKFVTSNTGDPTAGAKEKRDFETESDFRKRAQKNQEMGGKREKISDWASKKIDKNQKLVEDATNDMGKVGKFAADAYGGALGMGIDAATGPLAPVTMFMRSAGTSYNDAKKEGASDEQAYLYGMSTGALEAATEKMFSIAKPLQKMYGKGVADDLTERVLHKLASKATSEGKKNAIYHGGKTLLSAMSEGLEEMVSEGLEPTIANKIYADAAGVPHSTSAKDVFYAGAVGGVLGGVLGGAGQAVEYSQGKTVQNVYGDEGLKKLLKTAMDSNDEVDAKTATALNEMVNSGKPIAAGQALKVQQAVQKQIQQDSEQMDIADKSAYQIIKNNHFTDVLRKDNDGLVDLSTNTRKIYENAKEDAQEALESDDRMQLKDLQADEITSAVASIRAGVADVSDINLFTIGFPEARTVYETTTGETLPKTNKETRAYLVQKNATNKVASAEAETAYFVDTMKGVIQQDVTPTYDAHGQNAFEEHIVDSLRVGNPLQVENSVVAFEDYYESGRRGTSFEEINAVDNPAYATLPLEVRKAAYEAGVQDQIQANQASIDASLEVGKKAEKNASETKSARQRGKLITEFSDVENKKRFTAQEQRAFRSLARTFNIDIHITDNVNENGHYVDGEVWMSVDADRNLAYVFAHEITHHMEKFAPQEYQRLKQLVREAWDVREMNEALERKITQYKNHGKTLTREAALDEILADATYEMLQDESFVESLCIEERSIAHKILDAIQNVIKKLRQILIDAERFTPAQNEALLSQLDILKDAEKLWTDGLMKSAENRDAVGDNQRDEGIQYQVAETDSEGNELSQAQQEYFADSKVRDEEGNLLVMYHGTPNAGFTVFKDGSYFTQNEEYAEEYKEQGASYSGYKQEANDPDVYKVYLNITKPFDTRNEAEREIFENEYYGQWGMGTPLMESGLPDWMDGEDLKEFLEENEYDYDGLILDEGGTGGYEEDVKSRGLSYVVFSPEQVKNVDNVNPTDDEDIRFSLKEPVEETKDLIALHNIRPENMRKSLELGGFPMPSIAITKTEVGHTGFGEISLLFAKDAIDPEYEKNKVYGADAWTPIFPQIEYEVDEKKADEIYGRTRNLGSVAFFNPSNFHPSNLEDALSRNNGEHGLIEKYQDDYGLKQLFLKEHGEEPVKVKTEEIRHEIPENEKTRHEYFLEHMGEDAIASASEVGISPKKRMEWISKFGEEVKEVYRSYLSDVEGLNDDKIETKLENTKASQYMEFVRGAIRFKKNGGVTVTEEPNYTKAKATIDEKIDAPEYEAWLKEFFSGIEGKRGVWNGKDPYTEYGDAKSFDSLHYPVTLDNIVQAMLDQADNEQNATSLFVGTKTIRAITTQNFENIDEIKGASKKIENTDTEEYATKKEALEERLSSVMQEIISQSRGDDVEFMVMDQLGAGIAEACKEPTTANFKDVLEQYGWDVSDEQAEELASITNAVMDMPVNMFEAKPQRAVGFEEVQAAVVPSDLDAELKAAMEEVGIETVEYEAENNEDRIEKVNSVSQEKDIRFSVKESFSNQVEAALKGTLDRKNHVYVCETPQILQDIGLSDFPMLMTQKHIRSINEKQDGSRKHFHGIDKKVIKRLPEYLEAPVAIMDSLSTATSKGVVILTEECDSEERPIIIAIKPNGRGFHDVEMDSNFVLSMYGRDDFKQFWDRNVQEQTILYLDNKKSNALLSEVQLQSLQSLKDFAFDTIIRKSENAVNEKYSLKDDNEPPVDRFEGVIPSEDEMFDYVNMNETEFMEVPPVRDYEFEKKRVRQQTYDELRKQVESLKNDKRLTKGKVLDVKSVSKPVNEMVRTLMSMSEGTPNRTDFKLEKMIKENMKSIFRNIKNGNIEDAMITAFHVAQETVENLKLVNDSMFEEYKELRNYLHSTRVTLSEEYRNDIADFKDFKKSQQGRLRIVNEGGTSVDNMYMELVERWPELFDANITHPADQLLEIADVRESLEPYDMMLSAEETEQLIKVTAEDILDITALGKPWKSFADKKKEYYDYFIKSLKQKHKEAVRDIKKKERERYEEKLEKQKEREQNVKDKVTEKYEEKLKSQKEKITEKYEEKLEKQKDKVAERYEKKLEQQKEKVKEERWVGNERVEAERMRGAQAVQKEKDKAKKKKENQRHREFVKKMEKEMKWLSDRLLKPTDDKHLPEGYQKAIAELLCSIDTQSERSRQLEMKFGISKGRMDYLWLKEQYEQIAQESEDMILDEEISENLKELAKTMRGRLVSDMTSEELEKLYRILRGITHGIRNINNAFTEGISATIEEMANDTLEVAAGRKKYVERSGLLGAKDTLLNESMVTPRDFFEHLGGGMETAFMSIRKGFDKHVDNITVARDFFDGLFRPFHNKTKFRKNAKPGSRIEEWRDSTTAQEFELETGEKITLNIAQRMTLYCMMKRTQAQSHIFGSGIVASQLDLSSNIKKFFGAKVDVQHLAAHVTLNDVTNIIGTLTDEQIQVADQMQDFLNNECSEWGNEASMRMYGYKKFTEVDYFPIKSSDAYLDKSFKSRESTERIRNFGFTKGIVVNADNPIMIDDIFTVFADHVNKMSLYNSFAAPIADMTRLYNHKTRDENGISVNAALDNAYGSKTGRYIKNFMADLQNNTQTRTDGFTRLANKGLANYKKSAIGFNLRVAVQQPTAIMRAFVLMSPKYFVNANINVKKNVQDMKDHCQIARWKSWGFSQVDMARDLDDIMMNNEWSKLDLVTMEAYGALDTMTWSTIWAAVRKEIKDKHPDVTVDSDEFYELCNERASEVFDKTQVVDSVLHRSQVMRNTDTLTKILTGFMAEPTRTFNMMRSQYADAKELWRSGEKGKATAKVMHATNVYIANAMACAMAAAIADMLRGRDVDDDDEPDDWWANTLSNFKDGVNPLNMIPVLKEIPTFWEGCDGSNMALEGLEKLVKASKAITDKLNGENDKSWKDLFTAEAEAIGYVSGLPVKNVLREMKIFAEKLGIDVFASTGESDKEVKEQKKDKKLLDIDVDVKKLLGGVWGWISADSGDGTSAVAKRSGVSKEDYDKQDGILGDIGGAIGDKLEKFDKFLKKHGYHLNDEEQAAWDRKEFIAQIKEETKNMNSLDAEDYIWKAVTHDYTTYIKDGNFKEIDNMRDLLTELDEDLVEGFDESVLSKTIARYKRTLGTEVSGDVYKQYIQEQYGYSDAEFSANVLVKSKTAEKFQKAAVEGNDDEAVDALAILIAEGLTYGDSNALWEKRYNAVDMEDYTTHELVCPVTGTVTSSFGYRSAPTAGASTYHEGIDIAAPAGTEVCAADGGKVTKAGWSDAKGWHVVILHGNGRYTEYAHLNEYYFQKGEYIHAGQQLGTVGSTGISTGPHLDFRVKENGNYVDPAPYLGL